MVELYVSWPCHYHGGRPLRPAGMEVGKDGPISISESVPGSRSVVGHLSWVGPAWLRWR